MRLAVTHGVCLYNGVVFTGSNTMPRGPEQERLDRIMDALMRFGWLACHFRPAYTSRGYRTPLSGHKGFPDIVAVHPERGLLLFCEVKSDKGRVSKEQRLWIEALDTLALGVTSWMHMSPVGLWLCDSPKSEAELLDLISGGRLTAGGR